MACFASANTYCIGHDPVSNTLAWSFFDPTFVGNYTIYIDPILTGTDLYGDFLFN
jgi:hypothetical protein